MSNTNKGMFRDYGKYIFPATHFYDAVPVRGKGSYVWDIEGRKILDMISD